MPISRRTFVGGMAGVVSTLASGGTTACRRKTDPGSPSSSAVGERLYNGIQLPAAWPPRYSAPLNTEPPYLATPPSVIPIDVGRQLFVDDFLIDKCSLHRSHHAPQYVTS